MLSVQSVFGCVRVYSCTVEARSRLEVALDGRLIGAANAEQERGDLATVAVASVRPREPGRVLLLSH